jgi:quercetin dioxygenase-like cupin family protein
MTHVHVGDLASATEIPAGGTLSRTVHRDDRLRVVAFGFDEGQELTEHTAAMPAVVQVLRGRLRLTLGGETVEAVPGSWTWMEAHLPHSVVAVEPSVMLLTMVRDPASSGDAA